MALPEGCGQVETPGWALATLSSGGGSDVDMQEERREGGRGALPDKAP